MKKKLWMVLTMLALTTAARAETNNLTGLLQQGLFEEEANRNLDAAISNYQSLANAFDKDRQVAATAIFRLGECYRKLGQTNEAAAQYQRIVREFSDQQTLVTLSQQNLAGLGAAVSSPQVARSAIASDRIQQLEGDLTKEEAEYTQKSATLATLKKMKPEELRSALPTVIPDNGLSTLMLQLDLAEQSFLQLKSDYAPDHPKYLAAKEQVNTLQQKVNARIDGIMTGLQAQLDASQEYLNRLRAEIADQEELQKNAKAFNAGTTASEQPPITDEEEKEIRRIQQMIQNSPDLINVGSLGANGNWTPLYQAARSGWLRVATFLLDHGANVDADSGTDGKPLYAAAEFGNQAMVELLLSRGADVNARSGSVGKTALQIAAEKGFAAVTETLLNHKADVNATDRNGRTPLHEASRRGQVQTMKLLLAHGADVNAKDGQGYPPFIDALNSGGYERDVAAVETLLAAKPDVNMEFGEGRTVLGSAAAQGIEEIVKSLLEAKADPNGGTKDLPLAAAIEYGSESSRSNICWMLLQAGADPNRAATLNQVRGPMGSTYGDVTLSPIQVAVISLQPDIVKMLLDYKADANAPGFHQKTLLWEAIAVSNDEIAEALLAHGADANARDEANQTPLDIAVNDGHRKIVESLLEHGAEVNAHSGPRALTALHTAAFRGYVELMELLISHKADVNAQDDSGKTPLDYAKDAKAQQVPGPRPFAMRRFGAIGVAGQPGPTSVAARPEDVIKLLREHGALDELPQLNQIKVSRPSADFSQTVFGQDTNNWNQISLFDVLGVQYELVAGSPYPMSRDELDLDGRTVQNSLSFPDLKRIVIHRPLDRGREWKAIPVDVAGALESGDCSADVPLQFGDVVEIPEADHVINEHWTGLKINELTNLAKCLTRHVQITVKGQTKNVTLAPWVGLPQGRLTGGGFGTFARLNKFQPFMLWPALQESKLLLWSSDLSRVKVTRRDPATGKTHEWTVDCSNSQSPPNFWLRDGDVIEVPEKAGE